MGRVVHARARLVSLQSIRLTGLESHVTLMQEIQTSTEEDETLESIGDPVDWNQKPDSIGDETNWEEDVELLD